MEEKKKHSTPIAFSKKFEEENKKLSKEEIIKKLNEERKTFPDKIRTAMEKIGQNLSGFIVLLLSWFGFAMGFKEFIGSIPRATTSSFDIFRVFTWKYPACESFIEGTEIYKGCIVGAESLYLTTLFLTAILAIVFYLSFFRFLQSKKQS